MYLSCAYSCILHDHDHVKQDQSEISEIKAKMCVWWVSNAREILNIHCPEDDEGEQHGKGAFAASSSSIKTSRSYLFVSRPHIIVRFIAWRRCCISDCNNYAIRKDNALIRIMVEWWFLEISILLRIVNERLSIFNILRRRNKKKKTLKWAAIAKTCVARHRTLLVCAQKGKCVSPAESTYRVGIVFRILVNFTKCEITILWCGHKVTAREWEYQHHRGVSWHLKLKQTVTWRCTKTPYTHTLSPQSTLCSFPMGPIHLPNESSFQCLWHVRQTVVCNRRSISILQQRGTTLAIHQFLDPKNYWRHLPKLDEFDRPSLRVWQWCWRRVEFRTHFRRWSCPSKCRCGIHHHFE